MENGDKLSAWQDGIHMVSTAERDAESLPGSLPMGGKIIKRVKHTKVPGVIID